MPSEMTNHGISPSSYFSEDVRFSGERQFGLWKSDVMGGCGTKVDGISCNVASSPMERPMLVDSRAKRLDVSNSYLTTDQKINLTLQRQAIGAGRGSHLLNLQNSAENASVARYNKNVQPALVLKEADKHQIVSKHYESGLFSSSLTDLFSRKLDMSSNNAVHGQSVDTVTLHYREEEPLESIEEIEAQTIGNLLPDDDDLFSGVVGGIERIGQSSGGDEVEELDLFNSIGGMDLGDDNLSSGIRNTEFSRGIFNNQLGGSDISIVGEHPFAENPSRTLFVRNINSNIEDTELRALFEQYGDICTLYTACKHRGFVMIQYYDIRAAANAMKVLQNKLLRRRKLDIHYSIPKDNPSESDVNQGTLVVSCLESSISSDDLRQIFAVYGEIKEIRETSPISNHKFVEFYDVRAAEVALHALNQSDIVGKKIKLEPFRPGGVRRSSKQLALDVDQEETGSFVLQSTPNNSSTAGFPGPHLHGSIASMCFESENGVGNRAGMPVPSSPLMDSIFNHGVSSSVPSGFHTLLRAGSVGNQPSASESGNSFNQTRFNFQAMPSLHPHSLPEYHDSGISPGNIHSSFSSLAGERIHKTQMGRTSMDGHSLEMSNSFGNGSSSISGHHNMWGNSNHQKGSSLVWPNLSSLANRASQSPSRLHGLATTPSQMMNSVLLMNNHHHVGSAPTVNPLWERRNAYPVGSPESSGFHRSSLGSMRLSSSPLHHMEFASQNMLPHVGGNSMDFSIPSRNVGFHSLPQRGMLYPGRGQMSPMTSSFEPPNERLRNRRNENGSQADKKQFELDIDRILRGEDNRTTLMIKNIPNKYTSKMLMAAIDERHRGTYDFIYLPIDFKNKCNVGYAFINMVEPGHIVPFYETLNGKKWEKFNSEKVASLAYARIQGKSALIAHFQNSSLMNEDKRCRPILFHTDGPNAGDQVPFPMGANVRPRTGKSRTGSGEDNQQGSSPSLITKEDSSNLDSGSGKESD